MSKPLLVQSVLLLLVQMGTSSQVSALEVLVFSKTAAYRHDEAIDDGNAMFRALASRHGWKISFGEESTVFDPKRLATTDCVVWNNVSGNVLAHSQREALQIYLNRGGGFVAIHNAVHAESDWHYFKETMGGYTFRGHAKGKNKVQECKIIVEKTDHPITKHLPASFTRNDEWYNFAPNPGSTVRVLLHLDESTLRGPKMGMYHPITWTNELDGKRVFCTCLGHTPQTFEEPEMIEMFLQATLWASGEEPPTK